MGAQNSGAAGRWARLVLVAAALAWLPSPAFSQATQGMVSGRVLDSTTGRPIEGADVVCSQETTNTVVRARTGADGSYVLPLIPPGTVRLSVSHSGYQQQQIYDLEVPVAGRVEAPLRLRPLQDVWESGQYHSMLLPGNKAVLNIYGPDLDRSRSVSIEGSRWISGTLESSLSYVIEPNQIADLPLSGRDAYTALITLPGVTADTATARSLGLAADGQRPSASNFLLDGLENNNNLVTGPLVSVAPEAIQEYRVSTSSYSAEYGGTTGYIANAVTRAGSSQWHGLGYLYMKNDALNATDFQDNRYGRGRLPRKELQPGFHAGGPIFKERLLVSASVERFRSRSRSAPAQYRIPTPQLLALTAQDSQARSLLTRFPPPAVSASGQSLYGTLTVSPPVSVDRWLALPRVDYTSASGVHHLMARVALSRLSRPDFAWSPYEDFIAGFDENDTGLAVSLTSFLRPGLTNEARLGGSWGYMGLLRPHPEIPALSTGEGVVLPSSSIFSEFTNDTGSWEMLDNLMLVRGRHAWKVGGGFLTRTLSGDLTAGRDGLYFFNSISDFAKDKPRYFDVALSRRDLPNLVLPRFDRRYRLNQFFGFFQDSYRVASRVTVNYGVRYESHGAPRNVGDVKDALVQLGQGANLAASLAAARMVYTDSGDQSLYDTDRNDWAARTGMSWSLTGSGSTVIRAAYGIFYDRLFDNVWQNLRNNNFLFPAALSARNTNYLAPISSVLPLYAGATITADPRYKYVTLFQPDLRDAYAQNYFGGVQQRIGETWIAEANVMGSLGRKLLTTDLVNRSKQFNPKLDEMYYRGNQGISDYNAMALQVRYRGRQIQAQVSYTWSHSMDNQSELLASDYFNLNPVRLTGSTVGEASVFSRQFDSSGDRGNSAFDQRHNLIFFATMEFPQLFSGTRFAPIFRGWRFSPLGAFRSGLPFTVYSPGAPYRADYVRPDLLIPTGNTEVAGGRQLISLQAFARPKPGTGLLGTVGRNEFRGPGFYNIDLSVARSFSLPFMGEGGRLTLRADAFNFLNHANLNLPYAVFPASASAPFGVALYGRSGPSSGLPTLLPLNETSRQIQLMLRVEF